MVQFKIIDENLVENPCCECRSFDNGFCYKWTFPIQSNHAPCNKFKPKEKIETQIQQEDSNNSVIKADLVKEFVDKLSMIKDDIINRPFDEIYINLDNLIEEYKKIFDF